MALLTSTVISQSVPSILKHISKILPTATSSSYSLLYVLSPAASLSESRLSDLVTALTAVPNSVGCLSSPLPLASGSLRGPTTAVSLALFDQSKSAIFRSTIPGRKPTSVGRWHALRDHEESTQRVAARKAPRTKLDEIRGIERYELPTNIRDLGPSDIKTVVYFSDNSPEGLSHSLSNSFSASRQLGFLSSPTPFITGRPFTLFHGRQIYSSGSVGICLSTSLSQFDVTFPQLDAITDPLTVTSAEGNLVHSLDNVNPAQMIISAMEKHNLNLSRGTTLYKEDQYYLGVLHGDILHRLYQITAGGPSRGTVSLEGEDGPDAGTRVRLYHLPNNSQSSEHAVDTTENAQMFKLLTTHPELANATAFNLVGSSPDEDGTIVLKDTFLGASENGCIVRRQQLDGEVESPWQFSVPGGCVRFSWTG